MLPTILSEQLNLPTVAQKSLFGRSTLSNDDERDKRQQQNCSGQREHVENGTTDPKPQRTSEGSLPSHSVV